MSSLARIAASRANGSKSRGPVSVSGKLKSLANSARSTGPRTPEGKARSAQNALRHGILAESIVLAGESAEAFTEILTTLHAELRPTSPIEQRFVETMALAEWRRLRLVCLEREQLTMEIQQQRTSNQTVIVEPGTEPAQPAPVESSTMRNLARAFRAITDHSRVQELLNRYEARYDRQYMRALAGLRAHRAERRKEDIDARRRQRLAKARKQRRKLQFMRKITK